MSESNTRLISCTITNKKKDPNPNSKKSKVFLCCCFNKTIQKLKIRLNLKKKLLRNEELLF